MAPLPNVELSYGPMLIGVFCNMILYGVFVGQALTYYQLYHKDETWMRYFVLYLFVLETLNTALDMAMMYQPLILEYGRQPNNFPAVFLTQPMLVVLIATPIQLFFAWRIWTITRPRFGWLPFVIGAFAVAACAGGLWTAVKVGLIGKFARKPELHVSALLWFLASCVADVLITISLVMTLSHRKTGFVATDTVIDKIIRTTIQTGLVTSVFSILDVICFMVFPHYAINFLWDLALSKLYSNALLSTLNARGHLGTISTSRPSGSRGSHGGGVGTTHNLVFEDMALVMGATPVTTKFEETRSFEEGTGTFEQGRSTGTRTFEERSKRTADTIDTMDTDMCESEMEITETPRLEASTSGYVVSHPHPPYDGAYSAAYSLGYTSTSHSYGSSSKSQSYASSSKSHSYGSSSRSSHPRPPPAEVDPPWHDAQGSSTVR